MTDEVERAYEHVREAFERYGLVLLVDKMFPSVATIMAGEPIRGSWWGHPVGGQIFATASKLAAVPDTLTCKLLSGKVTYMHRRLWPSVLSVACSREPWQLSGLSELATELLHRADTTAGQLQLAQRSEASAARELEKRLLVFADEVHTSSGAHAKVIESWTHWRQRRAASDASIEPALARSELERLVGGLNAECGSLTTLPWQS